LRPPDPETAAITREGDSMSYKIDEIEGIGPAYAAKLQAAGLTTTEKLLAACATPKGRATTAETTGLSPKNVLTWTNMADLMRLNGVAGQFAELLKGAGVDTIKELRRRNAANLAEKMTEVNAERQLTKGSVTEAKVQGWIDQAKDMEPAVSY
jgi:predicted flap endonuclease-1-like 5' DNA nuclease